MVIYLVKVNIKLRFRRKYIMKWSQNNFSQFRLNIKKSKFKHNNIFMNKLSLRTFGIHILIYISNKILLSGITKICEIYIYIYNS